jgi:hypothetical protein
MPYTCLIMSGPVKADAMCLSSIATGTRTLSCPEEANNVRLEQMRLPLSACMHLLRIAHTSSRRRLSHGNGVTRQLVNCDYMRQRSLKQGSCDGIVRPSYNKTVHAASINGTEKHALVRKGRRKLVCAWCEGTPVKEPRFKTGSENRQAHLSADSTFCCGLNQVKKPITRSEV